MEDVGNPNVFVIDRQCDEKGMRVTNFDKWIISGIIALVFFVFCLPFIFRLSNTATSVVGLKTVTSGGKPTFFGIVLHAVIFMVIVRLLMH